MLNIDKKQSYIIFVDIFLMNRIEKQLNFIRERLGFSQKIINIAVVNGEKSKEALHQVKLAGEIIGKG